jgi:hypothetical protein
VRIIGLCIHAGCWPSGYTSSAINRAPSVSSPTFHLLNHSFTGLLTFLPFTHTTLLGRPCRWFLLRCQDDFLSHPVIGGFHMPWGWSAWRAGSRIDDLRRTGGFPRGFDDGPRRRTPITTMKNTVMHPHAVDERTLLTVLIRPLLTGRLYASNRVSSVAAPHACLFTARIITWGSCRPCVHRPGNVLSRTQHVAFREFSV